MFFSNFNPGNSPRLQWSSWQSRSTDLHEEACSLKIDASQRTINALPDNRGLVSLCSYCPMPSWIQEAPCISLKVFPAWKDCLPCRNKSAGVLSALRRHTKPNWTYRTDKLGDDYSHYKRIHHRMLLNHKLLYCILNKLIYKASFISTIHNSEFKVPYPKAVRDW